MQRVKCIVNWGLAEATMLSQVEARCALRPELCVVGWDVAEALMLSQVEGKMCPAT